MFSTLLQAARHTSAARDAARAAAAAASRVRVARRPAAASRSARSAAAAASCASIAVREALLYTDPEEEERPPPSSLPACKDVTDKDVESDEAIWALYELWCKAYNKERDHGEMARRFNTFKKHAEFVYSWNKGCRYIEEQKYLGIHADGINAQEMIEVESLRGYSDPKRYLQRLDFGMAKFLQRDFSRALTTMRGTIGYLAPEWISGVAITPKVDVYSYGILLFEIISGRRNSHGEHTATGDDYTYFPVQVACKLLVGDVASMVDHKLHGDVNLKEVERAFKVACWCIQDKEVDRPMTGEVVKILEGLIELAMPPMPRLLQAIAGGSYSV